MPPNSTMDHTALIDSVRQALTLAGLSPHGQDPAETGLTVVEHERGVQVLWDVHSDLGGRPADGDDQADTSSQPILCRTIRATMHHALSEILAATGHRVVNRMSDGLLVVPPDE